ncbi:uncharacterized mitochondrial protein AtMg00810-like [Ziziphus jujuba]|uniref:Uncharacterized mitochondrial protein AtMg00810-like n=1 Tax=Ziziphus jujuba TaxID=326968 RepID=A0ABM3ZRS0_ZIZJJ|nr:uncharacterized mitochondrial protein AtMg00810-like [Ziziphus jujuba]
MGTEFAIKDVGSLHYFLGVKVRYFSGGIFLSQGKYIRDLLAQAKMLEATHMATPMAVKTTPHVDDTRPIDAIEYRRLMGSLHFGLCYLCQSSLNLTSFCDADWARCSTTHCSTTGFCVFLGANCISWSSKKQLKVARSSTKAEYPAMASTSAELTWLSSLLRNIGVFLSSLP